MKNNYQFLVFLTSLLPMVLSATPVQVEAEDYIAMQGIEVENGGTNIGYFDDAQPHYRQHAHAPPPCVVLAYDIIRITDCKAS